MEDRTLHGLGYLQILPATLISVVLNWSRGVTRLPGLVPVVDHSEFRRKGYRGRLPRTLRTLFVEL